MATVSIAGEKHKVYKKTTKGGKGKLGDILVNHTSTNNGKWDVINLTKKAGAKTVKQGEAASKKWHKENPMIPKGYHKMPNGKIMKDSVHCCISNKKTKK